MGQVLECPECERRVSVTSKEAFVRCLCTGRRVGARMAPYVKPKPYIVPAADCLMISVDAY